MAGQTSAILKGFDYQHLLSWYHILSLLKPNQILKVKLENSLAGHVDDLTVYKKDDFGTIHFYQIKYHVDLKGSYSIDNLLDSTTGTSLLEKFWSTWKKLIKKHSKEHIKLILYSNWVHHPDDEILTCINGENGSLGEKFYSAGKESACGKKKEDWKKKHSASDEEFLDFTKALSFHLGRNFTDELKEIIILKMESLNLKHDDNSLRIVSTIVREWIKSKTEEITLELLEAAIKTHDLYLPDNSEKAVTVYFTSIKDRKFDLPPDYVIDWGPYFKQVEGRGDHELVNPDDWNNKLLPELTEIESRINNEMNPSLIRARGFSRLSSWFAFGHTFSEVSGYTIEVRQQNNLWRTDVKPNQNFSIISENGNGEEFENNLNSVAVGISLSGSLIEDVRKYLSEKEKTKALLLLKPDKGTGNNSLAENGDVVAFASQAKVMIRDFVKAHNADKVLLFYFGPLSGACFLGHQLNAVCKQIQIMENTSDRSYTPSFLLQ